MVLYNALPKNEYERIFMCKTAKDNWQSLLITYQDNSQVKDNKIDLIVQQYEQFTILEEESIDSGFSRFNTIITSLKALDEGFSSKNYVRKFLRALHPKWREKVTTIEESKDLSSLALDELIGNLKVHEVFMEKDSEIYRGKKEKVKFISLKAKKESSDDENSTSGSDDEEYAMAVRNFKRLNHIIPDNSEITRPETFRHDISKLTPFIAYKHPQGIIYLDKYKQNRLMRSDELYKFCDGTLTSVRTVLHDIANNLRIEYLPKRRWSNLDRKRSRIMIKAIDEQVFERRLMRNLEKFVGGRDYRTGLRLLKQTI
ncbi:hypothetical protein Tco_1215731 [Tanacetum coccineum]